MKIKLITKKVIHLDHQLCCEYNGRILARMICDSVAPNGRRLATLEVVVPRIVLAEFNTHRVFSRNSASSRAIPVKKMLQRVMDDPYIPETWGKNQKGMQEGEALSEGLQLQARETWLSARDSAVGHVETLLGLGVHKQTTNRLLEPFMWHTIIVTATEWSNYRHLRNHPAAHPAIQNTSRAMIAILDAHTPSHVPWDSWHLPMIHPRDTDGLEDMSLVKVSSARCGRVSYLTHDGKRDIGEDLSLHDKLLAPGHMSPFEHPAQAREDYGTYPPSNFASPWVQYRKMIPYEHDIHSDPERQRDG